MLTANRTMVGSVVPPPSAGTRCVRRGTRKTTCGIETEVRIVLIASLSVLAGCAADSPANPPPVSRPVFDNEVYPVLMRDCAFPDCHGNRERFFRVFGPRRTRLDPDTGIDAEVTDAERDAAFDRARSMLAGATRAEETLLIRKPLEVDRGGAPHLGIDEHGRDVYADPDDPDSGYRVLLDWARTGFAE